MIQIMGVVYISRWLKYRISLRGSDMPLYTISILYLALVQMFPDCSTVDQQPWENPYSLRRCAFFFISVVSVWYFIVYKMLLPIYLIFIY